MDPSNIFQLHTDLLMKCFNDSYLIDAKEFEHLLSTTTIPFSDSHSDKLIFMLGMARTKSHPGNQQKLLQLQELYQKTPEYQETNNIDQFIAYQQQLNAKRTGLSILDENGSYSNYQ